MQHLTSYSLFESESAEPLYPLYLTKDLLAHPGVFIFAKGSDAIVSLPPAEAFGLLYPNLELPSIGWENI